MGYKMLNLFDLIDQAGAEKLGITVEEFKTKMDKLSMNEKRGQIVLDALFKEGREKQVKRIFKLL